MLKEILTAIALGCTVTRTARVVAKSICRALVDTWGSLEEQGALKLDLQVCQPQRFRPDEHSAVRSLICSGCRVALQPRTVLALKPRSGAVLDSFKGCWRRPRLCPPASERSLRGLTPARFRHCSLGTRWAARAPEEMELEKGREGREMELEDGPKMAQMEEGPEMAEMGQVRESTRSPPRRGPQHAALPGQTARPLNVSHAAPPGEAARALNVSHGRGEAPLPRL